MKKVISVLLAIVIAMPFFEVEAFADELSLSAVSAVLIEAETGTVLYSKNADERRAMASTTKIMTAILMIEAGDLDRDFTVDPYAIMVEGTSMGLREGDIVSRRDLLYGILLPSGNDAANAAAVSVAGSMSAFVKKMNEKAAALGLANTHFVTPSGLDANGHYTTALDLAKLTAYAMKNEIFREAVSCKSKQVEFGNPPYKRTLYNSNKMLSRYDGAIGVKTGFTDNARRCLVSAAERDGVTLIAVTLNAGDDWNDHTKMLDRGFAQVKAYPLETGCSTKVSVAGTGRRIGVYADNAELALKPDQRQKLERRVLLPRIVYGEVKKGDRLGTIEFFLDGSLVRSVPLYAAESVAAEDGELNLWQKLLRFFGIYVNVNEAADHWGSAVGF
ncbi:MAG: D-alanyl-D-alanine carboxypeptidase [Oscillospiraceae bacterium]|nr:D-alanyl-D-alanine carboxypeptidase [Oscillospiraceae bacterium]